MKPLYFVLAGSLLLGLGGCAQRVVEPPPAIKPAPVCKSEQQCSAMWSAAMNSMQNLSGMRLQIANDYMIQTFNAIRFNTLSASARRRPMPDGTTAIEATFNCYHGMYCNNLQYKALNLFIDDVNMAGKGFE